MVGIVLLAIPAFTLLFLQNRQVQTALSKYMTEKLSEELQTHITLSSVNYSFFKRIQVRDLYVEDQRGDTLLFAELAKVRLKTVRPDKKRFQVRRISLESAHVNLVLDSAKVVNLQFIVDRLLRPHVPPENKPQLEINSIELADSRFTLRYLERKDVESGVNFTDLSLENLQIRVT
ncbi:MAG: hypothetical protein R2751_05950, partial [Bacteroidales bacterium]